MSYFPKSRAEIKRGIIKFSGGDDVTVTPGLTYVFGLSSISSKKGTLSTTINTTDKTITIPAGTMLECGFHVLRNGSQSTQNGCYIGFYDTDSSAFVGSKVKVSNYNAADMGNGDGYCRLVNSTGSDQTVQIKIQAINAPGGDDLTFKMGDDDNTTGIGVCSRIIVTEV
jgi:hypothetical protein